MNNLFNITKENESLTWQTIIERISLGFSLQKLEGELTDDLILKYNDAIVIDPDYQREYRSSIGDESSLIESALLDIPIPPIFLATQKHRGIQVLNVVDGQHRLRAFYRFMHNEYPLKGLQLLTDIVDKKFSDLELSLRQTLMSRNMALITFREFPGKDFELEIFRRYNKGTKPLTSQEIRHAVYDSKINSLVNDFCADLYSGESSRLSKAYAVSKDRFQKKNLQENIFVILSIVENGVSQEFVNDLGKIQKITKSPQYAEEYMKLKSENDTEDSFEISKNSFVGFNEFIEYLSTEVEYPFSREIYGFSLRGNKFQVSLSMILAAIFRELRAINFDFGSFESKQLRRNFISYLSEFIGGSYLEDPDYNASTTNPVEIAKLMSSFSVVECLPNQAVFKEEGL